MSKGPDVRQTEVELCRSQWTVCQRILFQVEISVRHRGVEHVLLQRGRTDNESRESFRDDRVHRSEERYIDSVMAIGSKAVSGELARSPT